MYQHYCITLGGDGDQVTLQYRLNRSDVVDLWGDIMQTVTPVDIRPRSNPWRGIVRDWDSKISELNTLIDTLNSWLPHKIVGKWGDDANESLNRLHIHFPDLERTEQDPVRRGQLSYYNDLIHEMQSLWGVKQRGRESLQLIISPEIDNDLLREIPQHCYSEFTHTCSFGDLFLHYAHAGRHPLEVFYSKDVGVPPHQIVPQTLICANHALKFFDLQFDRVHFDNFYHSSGIKWPRELSDPRLAVGYLPMGKLETVNNTVMTREQVFSLVRNSTTIIDWTVS